MPAPTRCLECGESFPTPTELRVHAAERHGLAPSSDTAEKQGSIAPSERERCPVCKVELVRGAPAERHRQAAHPGL
jgi:hypothetical protein